MSVWFIFCQTKLIPKKIYSEILSITNWNTVDATVGPVITDYIIRMTTISEYIAYM